MCETGSRKRKNRHDSPLETTKTVKGIFKKDDLDDSLSMSDWDLTIDESKRKSKRRDRSIRLLDEPLTLVCEWDSCALDFNEYIPFQKHLEIHWDNYESLACYWADCNYISASMKNLNQHICYHGYHTKLKSVGRNVEFRVNLPQCTQLEKFVIPSATEDYLCEWEYCNSVFETVYDFYEHVRVHIYHNPKGCKEGPLRCCWKGCTNNGNFPSQYKLTEHVRKHTKERILACPTCGNLFANKTKFCDHRKRQLPINQQSYLCSQCSKYFPSERLLRDHMRLHINQYKCSMCEMTCPKPSILAKHIRYRHLSEKPYKCNQCIYTCVSKHNLDIHLRRHDSKSHFKCPNCSYECRSGFGLERHYQKKHGKGWKNLYECHNCKKRFNRGGVLTKHLMKVHNYHWPSGHSRFRYKEDQDGKYRLQTVRYETLDVTEEIIMGNTVQAPSEKESLKFHVLKRSPIENNSVQAYDVMVSTEDNTTQPEQRKKVVITIDDIDLKGNVLKSQTIQSSEIICSNSKDIAETAANDIIYVNPEEKS